MLQSAMIMSIRNEWYYKEHVQSVHWSVIFMIANCGSNENQQITTRDKLMMFNTNTVSYKMCVSLNLKSCSHQVVASSNLDVRASFICAYGFKLNIMVFVLCCYWHMSWKNKAPHSLRGDAVTRASMRSQLSSMAISSANRQIVNPVSWIWKAVEYNKM